LAGTFAPGDVISIDVDGDELTFKKGWYWLFGLAAVNGR
jgi:hypothetical protein